MELHGDLLVGPGRAGLLGDLLEGQGPTAVGMGEDQPVQVVDGTGVLGHLVPLPVDQPEQLAPELGLAAYVDGVEDRVQELGVGHQ